MTLLLLTDMLTHFFVPALVNKSLIFISQWAGPLFKTLQEEGKITLYDEQSVMVVPLEKIGHKSKQIKSAYCRLHLHNWIIISFINLLLLGVQNGQKSPR